MAEVIKSILFTKLAVYVQGGGDIGFVNGGGPGGDGVALIVLDLASIRQGQLYPIFIPGPPRGVFHSKAGESICGVDFLAVDDGVASSRAAKMVSTMASVSSRACSKVSSPAKYAIKVWL